MNIIQHVSRHVHAMPDKVAVHVGGRQYSYRQLFERTGGMHALLRDMGVVEGDCVLVALDNGIEFVETILAAAALGAMVAPVPTTSPPTALQSIMRATGARHLVAGCVPVRRLLEVADIDAARVLIVGTPLDGCRNHAESAKANPLVPCNIDPDSDFLLTMTSGSTGTPKPIVLTQAGKIRRAFEGARDLYGLGTDDVVIAATPMYHSLGFRLALMPLLLGATSVVMPAFTPRAYIEAVDRHKVTFSILVSSQIESVLDDIAHGSRGLASLKTLVSSSALLRPEVKTRCLQQLDCAFHECYGASEVGIVTDLGPCDAGEHQGSVGRALDYVDLKIFDQNANELPVGQVGEICCRTTTLFDGYYRQPAATAASMRDRYFLTGDLGYVDEEGYLYLAGRKKDIIIVGCSNVYPDDVEQVLRTAPGVGDCAVIGVADDYFGEAVLACIVTSSDDADPRTIQAYCIERLADYQVPQAYEFVDQLPRTSLGKIRRQALRERFDGYDATARLRQLRHAIQHRA